MKSALLSLALLLSGTLAFAQSKISPEGQLLLRQAAQEIKANGAAKKSGSSEVVKVLVTLTPGATADDFADYNVDCKIGDKYVLIDIGVGAKKIVPTLDLFYKSSKLRELIAAEFIVSV